MCVWKGGLDFPNIFKHLCFYLLFIVNTLKLLHDKKKSDCLEAYNRPLFCGEDTVLIRIHLGGIDLVKNLQQIIVLWRGYSTDQNTFRRNRPGQEPATDHCSVERIQYRIYLGGIDLVKNLQQIIVLWRGYSTEYI